MNQISFEKLEQDLNYTFNNKGYIQEALIHSSFAHESNIKCSNERFELLGDAVLHLILTEFLLSTYPEDNEGTLSALRSFCESEPFLYETALRVNLGDYISFGKGELATGGRNKESLLANTLEAVIAAIHMDGGYRKAQKTVLALIQDDIIRAYSETLYVDSKSELQRLTQKQYDTLPEYRVVSESGMDHEKTFVVQVFAGEKSAEGVGRSKKSAEKDAARKALKLLQ